MKKNNFIITVLASLLIFSLYVIFPKDSDLGWHLRYGEYFIKTGQFLKQNIFSFYLSDYQWPNSYTWYQVFTFLIFKYSGFPGLSLAYGALFAFAYFIYSRIRPQLPVTALLTFLTVCLLSWHVFGLGWRSQIFTFTGIIITHYCLFKSRHHPKILIALPFLFALWSNLHGGFVLGLVLITAFAAEELLLKNYKTFSQYMAVLVFCVLFSFTNPYGVGVYREALRHMSVPLGGLIAEWVPSSPLFRLLILSTGLPLIFYLVKDIKSNKYTQRVYILLSIFMFSYLAFHSKRNIPLYFLTFTVAVLILFEQRLQKFEKLLQPFSVILIILLISLLFPLKTIPQLAISTKENNYCTASVLPYPCKAVEYIKDNNIAGSNVFSSYEWGGYLIWKLPEYKFFTDGRMPAWPTAQGKSPYTVYLELIQAKPGYQQEFDKYGVDWLLIGANTYLDYELSENKQSAWIETYRDNISVIYEKR